MPFFAPIIAIIAGSGLVMWGSTMIINKDDSADERIAKFIRNVPTHIKNHVKSVDWNSRDGFVLQFKTGTPQWVIDESNDEIDRLG